ncbi:type IV secretion system DNA-binding domain-containing protein, partial [Candidatus Peregrinibacteria bacterium]|nr:type IV secretion system DNA-binding domain-containing protein [Candidatus Peregrinibacteria bacterium]
RFRHFYVIGQTGTGKSSILQVMIRQDLANGNGICVVDPHGSLIEDILPFVPRERADDVIHFDPSDMERPLGLNILEGDTWEEKELVALDAMNIMIKLFDEEVFGPRIQDYFRNGVLTLMSDPNGAAITDVVRLFTDDDFAKMKRQHVTNPVVASFWDHQMAKTGAREKQEMIPYFAAKFGQFVTNTMMRNIIGQTKSAFDFAKAMQEKKIILMNLSKGTVGEINSKLLGLIVVQKIQMAALKRQKMAKEDRQDFFLYIDEFQNYVTESIEVILSEARKYRLGLTIAHQYLGQLEEDGGKGKGTNLKDAVFGNIGSMMAYKIGAQDAEHMAKEMAPVFSDQDLINIDKYKAVMKLSIDTQPSRPFSITPVNPYTVEGDKEAAEAYKQLSRLKFGRDREFVEREILRRIGAQ